MLVYYKYDEVSQKNHNETNQMSIIYYTGSAIPIDITPELLKLITYTFVECL